MEELPESAPQARELAGWVRDARSRTLDFLADLEGKRLLGPRLDLVNPPLWEVGHVAWFQERWILRHAAGRPPLRADADDLYDSIAIAHDLRWDLPLPSPHETVDYLERVRDEVLERLESGRADARERYFALYTLFHEDMHAEAFGYSRQTLGWALPPGVVAPAGTGPAQEGGAQGDANVPGGEFDLGAERDEVFVFDNEKWSHPVRLEPFAIARRAVTQGELADFADDGGYGRPELWSEAGRDWLRAEDPRHPVHWRRSGPDDWERRHFESWVPLERERAAVHVNFHEAEAYCRWAGRRLPSEAEWERAATFEHAAEGTSAPKRRFPWGDEPPTPPRARLDWYGDGCAPVDAHAAGDGSLGCRQMIGNVWEWTSSPFLPFPGFVRDAYEEYSEPWFATRRVLRGGSWMSASRMLRNTWRNYFEPHRRDAVAGFRTCALEP